MMLEWVLALMTVACPGARVDRIAPAVIDAAIEFNVPAELLVGVLSVETGCREGLVGAAGELGVAQIHPAGMGRLLASRWEMDHLQDVGVNVRVAARILRYLQDRCGGRGDGWVSAYSGRSCRPSRYSRAVWERAAGRGQ